MSNVTLLGPVEFINQHWQDKAAELICRKDKRMRVEGNKIIKTINVGEEIDAVIYEDGVFKFHPENGITTKETLSPFMVFAEIMHKGNYVGATAWAYVELYEFEDNYESWPLIMIGNDYYDSRPTKHAGTGVMYNRRERCNQIRVKSYSLTKDQLNMTPRFSGFTYRPYPFGEYRRITDDNRWNNYEPVTWKSKEGEFPVIAGFLEHIFGDKVDKAYILFKLWLERPTQKTMALVLASEERHTGKTTFSHLVQSIWGVNTKMLTQHQLTEKHNDVILQNLFLLVEEVEFSDRKEIERMKSLITGTTDVVNPKGRDVYEIPLYCKIVLTTNNVSTAIRLDDLEDRYWIVNVPEFTGEFNPNFLDDMRKEIPAFLYHLQTAVSLGIPMGRFWLDPADFRTEARDRMEEGSKDAVQKEIETVLEDICADNPGAEEIYFTAFDIKQTIFPRDSRVREYKIREVIRDKMELPQLANRTRRKCLLYTRLDIDVQNIDTRTKRWYFYPNPHYNQDLKIVEDDNPLDALGPGPNYDTTGSDPF